jgi:hypothetical protein
MPLLLFTFECHYEYIAFLFISSRTILVVLNSITYNCYGIKLNISSMQDYYAKINWYLLFASAVGSVNGFLWLFHPQLCISKEYKVRINYSL